MPDLSVSVNSKKTTLVVVFIKGFPKKGALSDTQNL